MFVKQPIFHQLSILFIRTLLSAPPCLFPIRESKIEISRYREIERWRDRGIEDLPTGLPNESVTFSPSCNSGLITPVGCLLIGNAHTRVDEGKGSHPTGIHASGIPAGIPRDFLEKPPFLRVFID